MHIFHPCPKLGGARTKAHDDSWREVWGATQKHMKALKAFNVLKQKYDISVIEPLPHHNACKEREAFILRPCYRNETFSVFVEVQQPTVAYEDHLVVVNQGDGEERGQVKCRLIHVDVVARGQNVKGSHRTNSVRNV